MRSGSPRLFNQIDFKSKLFLSLNRLLPTSMKDAILLSQMDIKPHEEGS